MYALVPGLKELISVTVCYEDLVYSEDESGLIYKDLALLSHNRTAQHGLYCNEDDETVMSEIMVIDTKKGQEFYDEQFVTHFES